MRNQSWWKKEKLKNKEATRLVGMGVTSINGWKFLMSTDHDIGKHHVSRQKEEGGGSSKKIRGGGALG